MDCNKCTTLVWDVDREGDGTQVGTGRMWEISVPSAQLFCDPKTAL